MDCRSYVNVNLLLVGIEKVFTPVYEKFAADIVGLSQ